LYIPKHQHEHNSDREAKNTLAKKTKQHAEERKESAQQKMPAGHLLMAIWKGANKRNVHLPPKG